MRIVKNNKRISVLGLIKFLAAIAIVYFHISTRDHWEHLWILVELFFFVTGYFTFKHFRKKENRCKTIEQKSKNAISYTIKKFLPLIPFAIIAIIIKYIALFLLNDKNMYSSIIRVLPLDILLLNSQTSDFLWPLWYLSAMLIVFPLFCLMCQTKHKNTLYVVLFTSIIAYYFNFFNGATSQFNCLIRAFFGMSAGILVYAFSSHIRKNKNIKRDSKSLMFLFIILATASILCLYPTKYSNGYQLYGILFIIFTILWLSILLSGKIFLSRVSSPTMDYLERISMIIYMIHIPVMYVLWLPIFPSPLSENQLLIMTILSSIVLSAVLNLVSSEITAKRNKT